VAPSHGFDYISHYSPTTIHLPSYKGIYPPLYLPYLTENYLTCDEVKGACEAGSHGQGHKAVQPTIHTVQMPDTCGVFGCPNLLP